MRIWVPTTGGIARTTFAALSTCALLSVPATAQDVEPCQDLGFIQTCDVDLMFLDYQDESGAILPGEFQFGPSTDAIVINYPNTTDGALTAEMLANNYIGAQAQNFGQSIEDMIGHGGQPAALPGEDVLTASYTFAFDEETITYITSFAVYPEFAVVASSIRYGFTDGAQTVPDDLVAVHDALLKTVVIPQ